MHFRPFGNNAGRWGWEKVMSTGLLIRQLESEAIEFNACADELKLRLEERVQRLPEKDREWYRESIEQLIEHKRTMAKQKAALASQWELLLMSAGLGITHG
jgi:hypothetical protein